MPQRIERGDYTLIEEHMPAGGDNRPIQYRLEHQPKVYIEAFYNRLRPENTFYGLYITIEPEDFRTAIDYLLQENVLSEASVVGIAINYSNELSQRFHQDITPEKILNQHAQEQITCVVMDTPTNRFGIFWKKDMPPYFYLLSREKNIQNIETSLQHLANASQNVTSEELIALGKAAIEVFNK